MIRIVYYPNHTLTRFFFCGIFCRQTVNTEMSYLATLITTMYPSKSSVMTPNKRMQINHLSFHQVAQCSLVLNRVFKESCELWITLQYQTVQYITHKKVPTAWVLPSSYRNHNCLGPGKGVWFWIDFMPWVNDVK